MMSVGRGLIRILMIWRSLPAILVYCSLTMKTRQQIDADLVRLSGKKGLIALHEAMLSNVVFRRQYFVRVHMESVIKYAFVRWTYRPLESLEISASTGQIGGGLLIYHGYSTIVFCHSMGKNCTVYQNVTIGRGRNIDGNDLPIIGDHVTIYAGAIVIGGIHIGDHSVIGAGTVVTKDVPANTVIVGGRNRMLMNKDEA